MVGKTRTSPREKAATLIDAAKYALDVPAKLENLKQLKEDWFENDPVLVSEFLPCLFEFQSDRLSPVRRFITVIVGDIGLMHMEVLPEVVPFFSSIMQDGAPAVARQAIICGIDLFRCTFEKVAIQGLYSSELDDSLESAWDWMLKFKEQIYSIAFQPGSDSTRLLSLKFVEAIILLYTPDPNGSSEPPPDQACEVTSPQFNISWLRGGHPLLNIGNLSVEASQSLGLLLDQLRFPTVKSINNSMIIVLIKSLATIATKRPAFYGRILPVLLGLDPSSTTVKGIWISAAHYALKKAFISCLDCVHPAALPWRERLVSALEELKTGKLGAQACHQDFKMNGDLEVAEGETEIKEEKPLINACDVVQSDVRKKRDSCDSEDDDVSGKRIRQSPVVSEELIAKESNKEPSTVHDNNPCEVSGDKQDPHSAPVRQLVDMFGALVAQGERAAGSLEILISSISADLLAEVVIANMQHLPCNQTVVAGDEESLGNLSALASDNHVKQPSALLAEIFSLSCAIPQIASVLSIRQSGAMMRVLGKQERDATILAASDVTFAGMDYAADEALFPAGGVLNSSDIDQPKVEVSLAIASEIHDKGNLENEIPGLATAGPSPGLLHEALTAASLARADYENTSQNPVVSVPSVSIDKSEELSPKSIATNANSLIISTATSVTLSNQIVFPKMSAPVVSLADEEKDNLQLWAFTRIVEAYKQIVVSGGADVQFSLLSYLGVELPLDLDPWKVLQKHILSDYVKNEGHELTLRVLYKLFGEAEERDFFSSTTAASVYEMFLLTVVETLRDSFPSSDKSFTKLLGEVPYLPKLVFKFLEELCSPGQCPKDDKDTSSGDRVTQGLSAVWSLILLRPPVREACLKIALQSAVHHTEEVRMKAIRLVANKLYPLSSIAQQIENFAKESLLSVLKSSDNLEKATTDAVDVTTEKASDLGKSIDEHLSVSVNIGDISETHQPSTPDSVSSLSISDAQRCMALYFALCTKKHSLFRQVFVIYGGASEAVKQAINRHIPILVRTIGSSPELLEIISDPPAGSEELLLQVIRTLTDGTIPSSQLIHTIRKSFESKLKNAEILVPVLPFLSKDEILPVFPHLVGLPMEKFQAALSRMLQGSSTSDPDLTPAEVLIAIHGIDPDRDRIPLKKVTDACNACFEQRHIFTQQVLAKVLNQLVEQVPLPLLFMRTVLQAIGAYPALVDFIMEILSRLVSKQIWKFPKLWVGFLKCTQLTKPQSFSVLLQLPPAQLENALNKIPALKSPLSAHASQPDLRSTLPRSVLMVLGVVTESQTSHNQSQASQVQTGETSNAETTQGAPAEKNEEWSEVDTKS